MLAIIDHDQLVAEALLRQLETYAITGNHFESIEALCSAIKEDETRTPDAILIEILDDEGEELETTTELTNLGLSIGCEQNKCPLILIAHSEIETAALKLKAAEYGVSAFLQSPLRSNVLSESINTLMARDTIEPLRILMIDTKPDSAVSYTSILEHSGMLTLTVLDPLQSFEMLSVYMPDLVLVNIPTAQATVLIRAMRYSEKFNTLPIAFLGQSEEAAEQQTLSLAGADEYLSKTLPSELLVLTISAKARRYRDIKATMVRDSLTGLYSYNYCHEILTQLLEKAQQRDHTLVVCLLDIDNLNQTNDQYGQGAGHKLLQTLARVLQNRLRRRDIIGRINGREFIIIMPETSTRVGHVIIDNLRENFSLMSVNFNSLQIKATLSGGLAGFPEQKSVASILEHAETALGNARAEGMNRINLSQS